MKRDEEERPREWVITVEQECGIKILKTEKLFSRRNQVYCVQALGKDGSSAKYAVKICAQKGAEQESFALKTLRESGVTVPAVLWHDQQILVLQYIEGVLLADLMEKEKDVMGELMDKLARWLGKLHSVKKGEGLGFCMPDLNLRNFLFDGTDFFGLDFEEFVVGPPERDLGCLAAFILNNDPMFAPWKQTAVKTLVSAYGKLKKIDEEKIKYYFFREMEAAEERRGLAKNYFREKIEKLIKEDLWRPNCM